MLLNKNDPTSFSLFTKLIFQIKCRVVFIYLEMFSNISECNTINYRPPPPPPQKKKKKKKKSYWCNRYYFSPHDQHVDARWHARKSYDFILRYAIHVKRNQNNEKLFSVESNSQTHYQFKLDFKKVHQLRGDKWLIHGTKHSKDNQLQSLELHCKIFE